MDDGEIDFSNQEMFSSSNVGDLPSNSYMDSFFDEIFKDTRACTHTHTCNPPGIDNSHTHTCFHVHTKIVPASSDDKTTNDDTAESSDKKTKKWPAGNREAVRKYREKKKARAASLEDEVLRLRAMNQQLLKRLQGQAVLEAEIARLKCLLVDIRGRIEGEIGSFPYQKTAKNGEMYQGLTNANLQGAYLMNPCNMHCDDQLYCLHAGGDSRSVEGMNSNGQGFGACEFDNLQCVGNSGLKEPPGCGLPNGAPSSNAPNGNKKKGRARAATAS